MELNHNEKVHKGQARDPVSPAAGPRRLILARCLPRPLRAAPDQAVVLPDLAARMNTKTIQRMPRIVKM